MKPIYFDNHEGTRPTAKAKLDIERVIEKHWMATPDTLLQKEMEGARKAIYELVGAHEEDQCIFTASEAEAAAHLFYGLLIDKMYQTGKNQILMPMMESATLHIPAERLEEIGVIHERLPTDNQGRLTVETLAKYASPKSLLLALSWANPLTGVLQPIDEIAAFCKERGILLYIQASDTLGKLFTRFQDIDVDFLSFDGHLIHAPKGTGALFVKRERAFNPLFVPTAPDHSGLIATGSSASEILASRDAVGTEIARLRMLFEEGLRRQIRDIHFFGHKTRRLPHISAFAIPMIAGELLKFTVEQQGLYLSRGGGARPALDRSLKAMGEPSALAKAAVSVALSYETTDEEIYAAIRIITESVAKLRALSQHLELPHAQ